MDREDLQGAKPVELSTVEALLEFQRNFETGFHFTDKEAEIILDYFEGHDYVLGHVEGVLHRGDLADKKDETVWEEFSMDDVIDLVCEWNYVIFSVNFINYCLNEIRIEEEIRLIGLMSEMLEGIKVLLWNRYGKQIYLVKTTKLKLPEILEIIAYIQRVNNEICSSFELPVIDICRILDDCFGVEMQNINFYERNKEKIKQVLDTVKRLKYHSMNKKSGEGVFLIESTDFWELYDGQMIPRETIDHSGISEIIKEMIRDNLNARRWIL